MPNQTLTIHSTCVHSSRQYTPRSEGVDDGLPPVERDGEEGEDAGGHRQGGDEVVHGAIGGAEHPHPEAGADQMTRRQLDTHKN